METSNQPGRPISRGIESSTWRFWHSSIYDGLLEDALLGFLEKGLQLGISNAPILSDEFVKAIQSILGLFPAPELMETHGHKGQVYIRIY